MSRSDQKPLSPDGATKPVTKKPSVADQAWHEEQIRLAIKEADAGEFASPEELKATIRKFAPNG